MWPMSSGSLAAMCQELGKHFQRRNSCQDLVLAIHEQPRQRTTGILYYRRKGKDAKHQKKSQNRCNGGPDAKYHVFPLTGKCKMEVYLHAIQYDVCPYSFLIEGDVFCGDMISRTEQISKLVECSLRIKDALVWLAIRDVHTTHTERARDTKTHLQHHRKRLVWLWISSYLGSYHDWELYMLSHLPRRFSRWCPLLYPGSLQSRLHT